MALCHSTHKCRCYHKVCCSWLLHQHQSRSCWHQSMFHYCCRLMLKTSQCQSCQYPGRNRWQSILLWTLCFWDLESVLCPWVVMEETLSNGWHLWFLLSALLVLWYWLLKLKMIIDIKYIFTWIFMYDLASLPFVDGVLGSVEEISSIVVAVN